MNAPTGIMRPVQQKDKTFNDLLRMFGPTATTKAATLEEQLQGLDAQELKLVLSTAQLVKLAHGFTRNNTEPYSALVTTMYPRMDTRLRSLIAQMLEAADPVPEELAAPTGKSRDAVLNDFYSEWDPHLASKVSVEDTETAVAEQLELDLGDRPQTARTPSSSPDEFISSIAPAAKAVAEELGIDPRIVIAQAALESGWGKSVKGNNLFGIKSHGKAGGIDVATHEVINGKRVAVTDEFRAYESYDDSVRGYGEFLKENPRYQPMLNAETIDEQIDALGKSGYATDPEYADKIKAIAKSKRLEVLS